MVFIEQILLIETVRYLGKTVSSIDIGISTKKLLIKKNYY